MVNVQNIADAWGKYFRIPGSLPASFPPASAPAQADSILLYSMG
jgi:hypothetical protein